MNFCAKVSKILQQSSSFIPKKYLRGAYRFTQLLFAMCPQVTRYDKHDLKNVRSVISQSVGLKIYHPRNFIFCAVYLEIVLDEHISIIFPGVISCPQKSPSFANKLSASSHVQRSPRSQAPARKNLQRVFLISLGAAKLKIVDESHSCQTTPKKKLSWNIQQWKYPWKRNSRKILKEEGHFHFRQLETAF